jgi:hypothetical protein
VNTPAAFPVVTPEDSSVMGGGTFTDRQDGTFVTSPIGPYGFSWLDLYLMGLASPDEVPPWFYVQNSNPPLGLEYWPAGGLTVSGTRRDVSIAQVIASMGNRLPASSSAQRQFVVCLVMLSSDPTSAGGAADTIGKIASTFQQRFATATGSRGSVMIAMPQPRPPRHRAAGQ